jgi:hypothetical protein
LRRQRHLLRLRESLWVLVIHLISRCAPKPGGYQAITGARGITVRGTPSASVGRARGPRDASGYATQTRHPTPHDHESIFTSIFIGN